MEEEAQNPNPMSEGMGSIEAELVENADGTVSLPEELGGSDSTRDFLDMIDFYQTAKATGLDEQGGTIQEFCRKYESISKGCGCTKRNRREEAEKTFLELASLDEETVAAIKGPLNVNKIRLFFNGGLFAEF